VNPPLPSFGPPPMPDVALPAWLVVKVVGRQAFELAWSLCWWSGVATGVLGTVTILVLILFAQSRRRTT
jgi:hypothetical protein